MQRDIVSATLPVGYIVCGFFTDDYRPLAEKLARDLDPQPHHFFRRDKSDASWRQVVHMKPDVVLGAMDRYPKTAIILLDVDSSVRGDLTPMLAFDGDVSAYPKLRLTRHPWPLRKKTVLHITTRAMVFKPTARAKDFLRTWRHELRTAIYHQGGCEMAMRFALMRSTGLAFCPMDARYSGREADTAPADAVIIHSSASRGKRW